MYDFICRIKEKGFLVKLDTNGRDPIVLEKLIADRLVDYIAMDVKYPLDNLDVLTGVKEDVAKYQESIDILRNSSIEYEFRTTIIGRYHTPEVMHRIGHSIQ